jgi:sarcosine oxidase subunit alpha
MAAGKDYNFAPYGTEAMTVMRTEKGHVAGPELDGRTTARDLGMGRMMSTKKDYIGRWLAARSALEDPNRPQLVGLKPVRQGGGIRMGAHLVTNPKLRGPDISEGHVTTSVFSPTLGHAIGLALLNGGSGRHGERIFVVYPLRDEIEEVEVVSPVFYDPNGERMRA